MSRPTVQELDQQLKDIVNWERLAIHLPNITQTDVDIIKRDYPNNVISQKQALFDKWLRSYPNASWDAVVLALEVIDENTLAENIQKQQYKQKVTPPILCKPTKHELKEKLKDLEQWESFATHLDGINKKDIDTIKKECHDDTDGLKQHLFEKWLNTHSDPSWELIIIALKKADENELAQNISDSLSHEVQIQEGTLQELSELHESFTSLSFESLLVFKEKINSEKLSLNDVITRTKHEPAYEIKELSYDTELQDVNSFFNIVSKHYHFLNCHLLVVLVKQFLNPSQLLEKLQTYTQDVKKFKNNAKIRYLHRTLAPFTIKSPWITRRTYHSNCSKCLGTQ